MYWEDQLKQFSASIKKGTTMQRIFVSNAILSNIIKHRELENRNAKKNEVRSKSVIL